MPGPKYTKEQKVEFFDLLDKGGSVRAAARAVGAHEAAAYSWIRAAGLTMQRATPRIYTDDEKAEFFRRLAERPNVSAVARELSTTLENWSVATLTGNHPGNTAQFSTVIDSRRRAVRRACRHRQRVDVYRPIKPQRTRPKNRTLRSR